jgi:hypothetical protein
MTTDYKYFTPFFSKYSFHLTNSGSQQEQTPNLSTYQLRLPPTNKNIMTMARPPSCPKSCLNMTRTQETLAKKYWGPAGICAHLFDAMTNE